MTTTDATARNLLAILRNKEEFRTNHLGNEIREAWIPGDRYAFDFSDQLHKGWRQYDTDQDASYFGVWVNVKNRETLTYAEGDWALVNCANVEQLRLELKSMAEFYGDPPPAFVVLDLDTKTETHHYDTRPSV